LGVRFKGQKKVSGPEEAVSYRFHASKGENRVRENGVSRFPAPGSSSADSDSFRFLLSELLWDASLLQYRIGRVAGQNLGVDGKRRSVMGLYQIS